MSRRTFPNACALRLAPLAAAAMLLAVAPSALATFPGRNGPIAFYSDTGAGAQIFTVRPNGHDLRQITHIDGDAVRPDWSPDGRRIAFELDTQDSASVAIMNADGSGMVVLPPAPAAPRATLPSHPTAIASSSSASSPTPTTTPPGA